MTTATELSQLESLSREMHVPLDTVLAAYQREHDALAQGALHHPLPAIARRPPRALPVVARRDTAQLANRLKSPAGLQHS